MGNEAVKGIGDSFLDLTEEGNVWRPEHPTALPSSVELQRHFGGERRKIPDAIYSDPRHPGERHEVGSATVEHQRLEDFLGLPPTQGLPPVPSGASSAISPERPRDLIPRRVVLQPGCCGVGESPHRRLHARRAPALVPVESFGELSRGALLTEERFVSLESFLPVNARCSDSWRLIYSPDVHGVSLRTFYRNAAEWPGETLVLAEDTQGVVFGGFASHGWQATGDRYTGNAECFVFSFGEPSEDAEPSDDLPPSKRGGRADGPIAPAAPDCLLTLVADAHVSRMGWTSVGLPPSPLVVDRVDPASWAAQAGLQPGDTLVSVGGQSISWFSSPAGFAHAMQARPLTLQFSRLAAARGGGDGGHDGSSASDSCGFLGDIPTPAVYTWAGAHQYFMYADMDGFAMGGGGKRPGFAFWLDKDFLHGCSRPSETFGNPRPLAGSSEFVLRKFECWSCGYSATPVSAKAKGTAKHETSHARSLASSRAVAQDLRQERDHERSTC